MSDTSRTIVPVKSDYPNRIQKAAEILEWLISIKAVKSDKIDSVLTSDWGYPIDFGAKVLVKEPEYLPFGLLTNGLEIITEKTVFHTGENWIDSFKCPVCMQDIQYVSNDFFTAFQESDRSVFLCPNCNNESDWNSFIFEPVWGFSNFGFTFYNWPEFTPEFINEFELILGCTVRVVFSII